MTTEEDRPVTGRQRALAWLSLSCAAVFAVVLVGLSISNFASLLGVIAGFAIGVAGGWWLVTKRAPLRWVGLGAAVLGVAVIVAAVVAAADSDRPVLRVAAVLVLYAVMAGSARLALVGDLHALDHSRAHTVTRPSHPVLICNPWSGGGKVEKFGIVEAANELGVETVMLDHGLDLEQLARDAIERGADCLGMAGGDGSQALVASIAVERGVPFVCISAGTRNHFALDLGIDKVNPRNSVYAFRDAVERRIDYATVNGRFFVNNVSLGVYATIVQQDGYREAKAETTKALLPEMLGNTPEPFDLQFTAPDGSEIDDTFLIQVSNNPYVIGPALDLTQRRRVDTGQLGVVAVSAASGREAAAMVTRAALGRGNKSRNFHEFTTEHFEVRSRSGKAFAGVDGEALEMETPLEFKIYPGGLRMLVPEGNLEAAEQRRARDVSVRQLLDIARS